MYICVEGRLNSAEVTTPPERAYPPCSPQSTQFGLINSSKTAFPASMFMSRVSPHFLGWLMPETSLLYEHTSSSTIAFVRSMMNEPTRARVRSMLWVWIEMRGKQPKG